MGSGFRTFAASEVLTSSNVQNYLMDQAVTVHGSTAILGTAIPSPEAGMVAYVDSGDSSEGLYTFNGSTWRKGPGWNAPWGFVQYTQRTTAVAVKNGNILTGNTISVVNRRRYRIHAQIQSFQSSVINDVAQLLIVVGGVVITGTRITATIANFAGFGGSVVAYYTAAATNASLACDLYNDAVVGAGTHQFNAEAQRPIFIAVEDIGPAAGAPV
jgi:hypothetical protein